MAPSDHGGIGSDCTGENLAAGTPVWTIGQANVTTFMLRCKSVEKREGQAGTRKRPVEKKTGTALMAAPDMKGVPILSTSSSSTG